MKRYLLMLAAFLAAIVTFQMSCPARAVQVTSLSFKQSTAWEIPAGITTITVKCWGKGGSARSNAGKIDAVGAGGGCAYAADTLTVRPNSRWWVRFDGNDVAFGSFILRLNMPDQFVPSVLAKGGSDTSTGMLGGGPGGQAAQCIGSIRFSGGNGGSTYANPASGYPVEISGGGGGGSAGPTGNGAPGANGATNSTAIGGIGWANGGLGGYLRPQTLGLVRATDGAFPGGGCGGGDNHFASPGGGLCIIEY